MRSALALSALLLLLLPPPPSLAQETETQSAESRNDTTTAKPDPSTLVTTHSDTSAGTVVDDLNMTTEPRPQSSPGTHETPTTGSSGSTLAPNETMSMGAPTDAGTTAASTQTSLPTGSPSMENSTNSSPTVASTTPQVQISTSVPTKLNTTSIPDGVQSLKNSSAPGMGEPATSSPVGVNTTSTTPVLSASTSPTPAGSVTHSSTSKDGDQRTVTSGGSTPPAGPSPVPSGPPSTLSTVPSDASPSHVPSSSLKPSVTETLTLSSGSPALETMRPTDIASSPEPVPSTGAPVDRSTPFTSAAPHDVHPSPTSTAGSYKVHCEPPERFSEKLLVLNFTKPRPCVESHFDDKLRTILCQAAKSTFNPAHDQCHIWLAPVPEIQALAVKKIIIETNLLPQDMYELMKDKWDALKEVGVSNMQLEGQGPPEEAEDRFSMPLIITIICMASFLLLVAALYGCCHQRLSQRKDQQRLTEELQTVENGYHDNPTLEVMETSSEMQEKKVVSLNGELGDSWIVPLDNLTKDDLDEEEDTHL